MENDNKKSPGISLVVPVYRSEPILEELVSKVLEAMRDAAMGDDFELILVNDCSPDGSWKKIEELAARHGFIRGLSLRRNFGQHSATMAGLHVARGGLIVIMDDDLQHAPSEIIKLVNALRDNPDADVCYTRYQGRQHAAWKKLGSWFNDLAATILLKKPRGLYLSSFKAIRRSVIPDIIKYDGPYAYLDGLILNVTQAFVVVDIEHQARAVGAGNYNLQRSISLWLKMATSFSIFPLRFATLLGFGLTIVSILMIGVVIYFKITSPETPAGWASLAATVLFVGGIQTFCIGMVGEYLGRAYLKLNGKPQFVVRTTTWQERKL